VRTPKGSIAPKFDGAAVKGKELSVELEKVAAELGCSFVDAGRVVTTSTVDGVHLDADQHLVLAHALAQRVASLLDAVPTEAR
jgi:lysophospholipase L1-like esterase